MGRFGSWRREARDEDIDGLADHQVNNEARSVYNDKYDETKCLMSKKVAIDEIRARLAVLPSLLVNPFNDGRPMPDHFEASNRAAKRLAALAGKAVEDALTGKMPRTSF